MNALLIGIVTGLDNFAVSTGFGSLGQTRKALALLVVAFAGFEALMPLVGYALASGLPMDLLELAGPLLLIGAGLIVAWRVWRGAPQMAGPLALIGVPLLMSLDNLAAGVAMRGLSGFDLRAVLLAGGIAAGISLAGLWLGGRVRHLLHPSLPAIPQFLLAAALIGVGGMELLEV